MGKQVKVVATALGFRHGRRRRVGDTFYVPEAALFRRDRETGEPLKDKDGNKIPVSWFERVKEVVPEPNEKDDGEDSLKGLM